MALTADDIKRRYDGSRLRALAVEEGLKSHRNRIGCPTGCTEAPDACTVHSKDGVGFYHCKHSCGRGGSVIDLLSNVRRISIAEAIKILGEREPPEPMREVKRAAINGGAIWLNLAGTDAASVEYLESRGLGEAVERELVRFNVGASGDFYCDNLSHLYRVAVPLRDRTGRVVTFQLRAIRPPAKPKDTKRNLPGHMPDACFGDPSSARSSPVVYLTEGMADTLALQLAGVVVVGAPGVDQLRKLPAFLGAVQGRVFVACPQNDERQYSQNAFEQLLEVIRQAGGSVRVLTTPELYKDPADWLQAKGLPLFSRFVAAAPSFQPPPPRGAAPEGQEPGEPKRFALSDLGNAERLVHRHGDSLRHCHTTGNWFHWGGTRWETDTSGEIYRRASETVRAIPDEEGGASHDVLWKHGLKSESSASLRAMIHLGATRPGIPIEEDDFDRFPWLLNCPNGTLDLRTGVLTPHERAQLHSKSVACGYDELAPAPKWEAFLRDVFEESDELINYLQRFFGYCLTGLTREHVFHLFHGAGRNGKGTLCDTIRAVMGGVRPESYAGEVPVEVFLESRWGRSESGPNEAVVSLKGKRFVTASEPPSDAALDTAMIKKLTGEDPVSASRKNEHTITFQPVGKYALLMNPRPKIRALDVGIQARLRFVPFKRQYQGANANTMLREELLGEGPGILAWLVRGAQAYQETGLAPPPGLIAATTEYFLEQDLVGQFLGAAKYVERGEPTDNVPSGWLWGQFAKWAEEEGKLNRDGKTPISQTLFGRELTRLGFVEVRPGAVRSRSGLRVPKEVGQPVQEHLPV
jgi:putative DNA primase/helicase